MASKKKPHYSVTTMGADHVPTPTQQSSVTVSVPPPKKSKKTKTQPKVTEVQGFPISSFPIGKIFSYRGKKWQKAGILQPGSICRCQLVVEKDGGTYIDPSVRVDLAPDTKIIP